MADETNNAQGNLTDDQKLDTQVLDDLTSLNRGAQANTDDPVEQKEGSDSTSDNSDLANVHLGGRQDVGFGNTDIGGATLKSDTALVTDTFTPGGGQPPIEIATAEIQKPIPPTDIPPAAFGVNIPGGDANAANPEQNFPDITREPDPGYRDDAEPAATQAPAEP